MIVCEPTASPAGIVRVAVAGLPESVALPSTVVPSKKVTMPSLEVGIGSPLGVVTVAVNVSGCPKAGAALEGLTEIAVGALLTVSVVLLSDAGRKSVRSKPTAFGRATRRASSDPACIPPRKA